MNGLDVFRALVNVTTPHGVVSRQPNIPSRGRENPRIIEKIVKRYVSEDVGAVLEKINNAEDSIQNVRDAVDPVSKMERIFTGKSVVEIKKKLNKGDHIFVTRIAYTHHGLYDGAGFVFEYNEGMVRCISLEDFAGTDDIHLRKSKAAFSENEIIRRAWSRTSEMEYNVIYNNCENFVHWCRHG
ncbi:lecithin retinol acyltransferase family protein [Propionispira raffinosivorans]|uniref:lecithin retinol acyltransferase family protein n=1 Tax=Propionispira raffinosivorans TaxID=86959 RepID=UPI0003692C49|nr:lecithin retinol acyltransferase family protein [Propionispira raffinosivorans]